MGSIGKGRIFALIKRFLFFIALIRVGGNSVLWHGSCGEVKAIALSDLTIMYITLVRLKVTYGWESAQQLQWVVAQSAGYLVITIYCSSSISS